jgi:L-iditol 2-dehydrogenase
MVKAVYMYSDGKIELKDQVLPKLEPGSVLVKTLYSEVCGTDVHLQDNQLAGVPFPIIPGHVSVGIIDILG